MKRAQERDRLKPPGRLGVDRSVPCADKPGREEGNVVLRCCKRNAKEKRLVANSITGCSKRSSAVEASRQPCVATWYYQTLCSSLVNVTPKHHEGRAFNPQCTFFKNPHLEPQQIADECRCPRTSISNALPNLPELQLHHSIRSVANAEKRKSKPRALVLHRKPARQIVDPAPTHTIE